MKLYIIDKIGRIERRFISSKNIKKYKLKFKGLKYKLYNEHNNRKHKLKSNKYHYYIDVYQKYESKVKQIYIIDKGGRIERRFIRSIKVKQKKRVLENISQEYRNADVKQQILEKFILWSSKNPKISQKVISAIAVAPLNIEDDGTYQLNNIETPKLEDAKFKLRVDKDLKQFTLIIDSKYNYDLDK